MRRFLCSLFAALLMLSAAAQKQPDSANAALRPSFSIPKMDSAEREKAAVQKVTNFTNTAVFDAALNAVKNKMNTDPSHEHILAFGQADDGTVIASAISTGAKSNSSIPGVPHAFADLHSHPKNTPPSSGDVYGLLYKNIKQRHYDTRYVVTPGGIVYALVVTDTTAAGSFLEEFPPQQTPGFSPLFPDKLLDEFRELLYRYDLPEERAMASILEKYKTGVLLLKQDNGGSFEKVSVIDRN